MLSTGSAFLFDLNDLQFLLHPAPVFAHPLLFGNRTKNAIPSASKQQQLSDKAETIEAQCLKNEMEANGGGNDDEKQQHFVDPLNASAIDERTTQLEKRHSVHQHNGFASGGDTPTAILFTERLNNTLAECESEQWPLDGVDPPLVGHRPWRVLRQRILDTFSSTTDRLSLESSFLRANKVSGGEGDDSAQRARSLRKRNGGTGRKGQKNFVTEQQQPVSKFHELTQDEWTRKLKELRRILIVKWEEENRLECIKLAAEVAALISTISSAQFYPAQFVHVTDFLDLFGHLVYERLFRMAGEERRAAGLGVLPAHFDTNDVLETTRMKTRNWFGKINETVALLAPRIYLLAALLPCQRFMDPLGAAQENVMELCQSVKQVQHPLISSYLRCYICRVAMRLNAADRAPHWKCLNDWLQTYSQQPTFLLAPAMEWIVQCVAFNAVTYADLHPLWEYCRLPERRLVVLTPMLNALPRLYLGEHALEACRIVTGSEMVSGDELCVLGANLLETDVPVQARKPILKATWKCVMRLASLKHYVMCCECWVEFVARYFGTNELNVMLDNMLSKLNQQQQQDKYGLYQPQLLAVLRRVFDHSRDIASLFAMDVFSTFVDAFNSGPVREEAFLIILRAVVSKHAEASFTDIDLAYQILSMCQSLHDCVEPSLTDECVESVISLISAALDRVDLSADPDQCLNFLVACRADLANIDGLQKYVLCRVQAFTLHIARLVRFSNSRAAFLQGCLANLFISIPSLSDPLDQIRFSIQSTQIALAAFAFFQVDSFVSFVLDTFDGLPRPTAALLSDIQQLGTNFLATLVHIPLEQQQNEEDDDEEAAHETNERLGEDEGTKPTTKWRGPLKHFRRFLHFVLCSPPLCTSAQLDFVRLLVRCLHYLCIVWPSERPCDVGSSCRDQNDDHPLLLGDNDHVTHQLQQQLQLHDNDIDQQQPNVADLRSICAESAEQIADALEPHLTDGNASDEMCSVGVELLELIAQFGPTNAAADADSDEEDDASSALPDALLALAKAVYKQCKRRSALRARIQRIIKRR